MTSAMQLWLVGGALAVLAMMIVVVMIARNLDGSQGQERQKFAEKMSELAERASEHGKSGGGQQWASGAFAQTLSALAAAAADTKDDPNAKEAATEGRKQLKATFTGLAIAGGIIMVIVGIVTGDGG